MGNTSENGGRTPCKAKRIVEGPHATRSQFTLSSIRDGKLWEVANMDASKSKAVIEQDHRFKKRIAASLGFRSAEGAWRTIEGYEAMHAIRRGQVRWIDEGNPVAQCQFIHTVFGIAV